MFLLSSHRTQVISSHRNPASTSIHYITVAVLATAMINPLTPNDHYSGRTAPLTSKRCILYIYSTNIDTEYFKRGI